MKTVTLKFPDTLPEKGELLYFEMNDDPSCYTIEDFNCIEESELDDLLTDGIVEILAVDRSYKAVGRWDMKKGTWS